MYTLFSVARDEYKQKPLSEYKVVSVTTKQHGRSLFHGLMGTAYTQPRFTQIANGQGEEKTIYNVYEVEEVSTAMEIFRGSANCRGIPLN